MHVVSISRCLSGANAALECFSQYLYISLRSLSLALLRSFIRPRVLSVNHRFLSLFLLDSRIMAIADKLPDTSCFACSSRTSDIEWSFLRIFFSPNLPDFQVYKGRADCLENVLLHYLLLCYKIHYNCNVFFVTVLEYLS